MDRQSDAMEVDIDDQELVDSLKKFETQNSMHEDVKQQASGNISDPQTCKASTSKASHEDSQTEHQKAGEEVTTTPKNQPKIDTFFHRSAIKKAFDPNACRSCKKPIRW